MAWPTVSAEAILAARPEVIIELVPETPWDEAARERMRNVWTRLGSMPATETGRIYFITADNALIPSPRYVEIIAGVAEMLHGQPAPGT
jgi:ABC-type Fe3+-hydroxamate transport system substrate-binding protein